MASIVDGVTKLDRVQFDSKAAQQAATMRKMLVAMAKDLRVLIIKLAKTDNLTASISRLSPSEQASALSSLREQAEVQEATLFTARGRILAYAGNERPGLMPDALSQVVLRQVRQLAKRMVFGFQYGVQRPITGHGKQ